MPGVGLSAASSTAAVTQCSVSTGIRRGGRRELERRRQADHPALGRRGDCLARAVRGVVGVVTGADRVVAEVHPRVRERGLAVDVGDARTRCGRRIRAGDLELDGLADNRITLVVGERRRHRVIRPPEVLGRRRVEGQLEVDERRSRPAVDRRVRHEADPEVVEKDRRVEDLVSLVEDREEEDVRSRRHLGGGREQRRGAVVRGAGRVPGRHGRDAGGIDGDDVVRRVEGEVVRER